MKNYLILLRPKDWAKNLFLFVPSFFAGVFFDLNKMGLLLLGFFSFSCVASSIYILNDYLDLEEDRNHPEKCNRPLPSGSVQKGGALFLCIAMAVTGLFLAYLADYSFKLLFVVGIYMVMNWLYCFGLKNVSILDILIVSAGFVLRVKAGAVIAQVDASDWLIIMTFLLSLFMAIAKRRDDMLIKRSTGMDMRKSMKGYNLDFLNTMLALFSAILIVAYINYTVSPMTLQRLGTHRLYYSSLFVVAGIMRYLQITFVQEKSGSPTEILFRDRFIQITLVLWATSIYAILYLKDFTFFKKAG